MEIPQEFITTLTSIQKDLVGILISVIITSATTILTLIINSILQITLSNKQYKNVLYETLRKNYPQVRTYIAKLRLLYSALELNPLYEENFSLKNFRNFDWAAYRKTLTNDKIDYIDDFQKDIEAIIDICKKINIFFESENLPTASNKVYKKISHLQSFCMAMSSQNKFPNKLKEYNLKEIDKLIRILDKHYNKI